MIDWLEQAKAIISLQDYNTRVVVIGVTLLGMACGVIGVFLLLRRRALVSDAVSHAALPGICVAYFVGNFLFGTGKLLPLLLLGAVMSALTGMGCLLAIRKFSKLKEDAAIGIVISVFFGLGVVLLGLIQKMRSGHAAGLEGFIYGKTASLIAADAQLIAAASLIVVIAALALSKEFSLLCFNQEYAAAVGYPVATLDGIMLVLVVAITIVGLQAVGLILMIALLILPATAARFWSKRIAPMLTLSAIFGVISGFFGAIISASLPKLPAGAIIVLVAGGIFVIGLIFGKEEGILRNGVRDTRRAIDLQMHQLLLATQYRFDFSLFDAIKKGDRDGIEQALPYIDRAWLIQRTHWGAAQALFFLAIARFRLLLRKVDSDTYQLTWSGLRVAICAARSHELQHLFTRRYPEQAQGMQQRDEPEVELHLAPDVVAELIATLTISKPQLFNRHIYNVVYPSIQKGKTTR